MWAGHKVTSTETLILTLTTSWYHASLRISAFDVDGHMNTWLQEDSADRNGTLHGHKLNVSMSFHVLLGQVAE